MRLSHKTLPLVLAVVVGALLTAGLWGFASVAGRMQREEALLRQEFRAEDLASHLDAQLASSEQVARTLAALARDPSSRQALERLLRRTFASTSPHAIHGLGVYFAPYRFQPGQQYMGPYIHWGPEGAPVLTYEWSTPAYDYPRQPWYQGALEREGSPLYTEPYWDSGQVYQTIALTFSDARGRVLGVVSVDMTLPQLQRMVADVSAGDFLYVTSANGALLAHPQAEALVAWARSRGRQVRALSDLGVEDLRRYEREQGLERTHHTTAHPLQRAGWTVHVSAPRAALFAGIQRLHAVVLLCGAALWGGLLAAAFAARRSLRVHGLSRALAEQERTRHTLAASEHKLRQVLQTAMDGVIAVDAQGRIVEWNARAEQIFGWRQHEVLGHEALALLTPPWFRERHQRERARRPPPPPEAYRNQRLEMVGLRRNGEEFPVELNVSAVMHEGAPLYYAFFEDISERRRKDEELQRLLTQLRQRTAELHAILDNMVDAVLVADTEGHLPLINPAARELFGRLVDGPPRSTAEDCVHCDLQTLDGRPLSRAELPLMRALQGEVVLDATLRLPARHPGGRGRVVRSSAAPIRDESGRVVAAVSLSRDVTQAVELERLKDEFLRVAAHELKTPVAVMKSYAQLALKTGGAVGPGLRRLLEGVGRGADRLDQVIRTLLDASQLHLGALRLEARELRLRALVEGAVARAAAQHPRHDFHLSPGPDARVEGDGERLGQVLLELLDNAARYSSAGSAVDVTLEVVDGEVEVAIRDEGVGIAREQQARLFERFYRPHSGTAHDRGGMGLGLYLAREITRLHHGHLLLESEPGRGTTVRLRLPGQPGEHPRPTHARDDAHPPPA